MALSNMLFSLLIALYYVLASAMVILAGVFTSAVLAIVDTLLSLNFSNSIDASPYGYAYSGFKREEYCWYLFFYILNDAVLFWSLITRFVVYLCIFIAALLAFWQYRKSCAHACKVAAENAKREREAKESRGKIFDRIEANLGKLESETEELQTAHDDAIQKNDELKTQNEQLRNVVTSFEAKVQALEAANTKTSRANEDPKESSTSELAGMEKNLNDIKTSKEAIQAGLDTVKTANERLGEQRDLIIQRLRKSRSAKKEMKAEYEKILEEKKHATNELEEKLAAMTSERDKAVREKEKTAKSLRKSEAEKQNVQKSLDEVVLEKEQALAEKKEIADELRKSEAAKQNVQKSLGESKTESKDLAKEKSDIADKLRVSEAEKQRVQKSLGDLKTESEKVTKEKTDSADKLRVSEAAKQNVQKSLDDLKIKNEKVLQEKSKIVDDHQIVTGGLKATIERLEKDLEKVNSDKDLVDRELKESKSVQKTMQASVDAAKAETEDLRKENTHAVNALEPATKNANEVLQSLQKHRAESDIKINKIARELQQSEKARGITERRLHNITNENLAIRRLNEEHKTTLHNLQAELDGVVAQRNRLLADNSAMQANLDQNRQVLVARVRSTDPELRHVLAETETRLGQVTERASMFQQQLVSMTSVESSTASDITASSDEEAPENITVQLPATPDSTEMAPQMPEPVICRHYMRGNCWHGDQCYNIHPEDCRRPKRCPGEPDGCFKRHASEKPCVHHMNGWCSLREDCPNWHPARASRTGYRR